MRERRQPQAEAVVGGPGLAGRIDLPEPMRVEAGPGQVRNPGPDLQILAIEPAIGDRGRRRDLGAIVEPSGAPLERARPQFSADDVPLEIPQPESSTVPSSPSPRQ
jgi:hypothetical protein